MLQTWNFPQMFWPIVRLTSRLIEAKPLILLDLTPSF